MFEVFTDEIEFLIKEGIANLFWKKDDLENCLVRAGIDVRLIRSIRRRTNSNGQELSKNQIMEELFLEFRQGDKNRRIEVSRKLARTLIERREFSRQDPRHQVEKAEKASLKLRLIHEEQMKERERREVVRANAAQSEQAERFMRLEAVKTRFLAATKLSEQERGYELEKIVVEFARASGIAADDPYRIPGEQIDGAIHYDGHTYLLECKWTASKVGQSEIGAFYFKVEGKFYGRGILISMGGYTDEALNGVRVGKEPKVLLLDAGHITNAIYEIYSLQRLLDHSIRTASMKSIIFCDHDIP